MREIFIGFLKWVGHIAEMTEQDITENVMSDRLYGLRIIERRKLCMEEGASNLLGVQK